ncbi:hypothetical protein [Jiella pelagia]|uniref:Probable ATP-binding protein BrxC winged helix-turn-helix domain-containing protein n=1 Tax=Jiella pelagia TaxID=2986949 RepID=A0ABY7C587_9HYPH|nr:hypothetical protein [Jiella pelagia]WAP70916.1 hypothetical protein OH818_13655 [Jiella pelagia]
MLRSVSYGEADLGKACRVDGGLFGAEGSGLTEPEQEVLNRVQAEMRVGVKVSVNSLVERFGGKPYGWPAMAVLCIVGSLVARGKVEARVDGELLEGNSLAKGLGNSRALGNILLSPQIEFTASQIRKSRELYQALFDVPAAGSDARTLGPEWLAAVRKLETEAQRPFAAGRPVSLPRRTRAVAQADRRHARPVSMPREFSPEAPK